MSKNTLDKLFGSAIRVRLLKFLFRNNPTETLAKAQGPSLRGNFNARELSKRIQGSPEETKKELDFLVKLDLVNKKRSGRPDKTTYSLNPVSEFFEELKNLILKAPLEDKSQVIKKINGLGKIKLAVISGVFINDRFAPDTHNINTDLFIVGDNINNKKLRSFLASLEAEVGKELKFSLMGKEEFQYRYGMFDRFVRVLLEGPHEKIINKMGI